MLSAKRHAEEIHDSIEAQRERERERERERLSVREKTHAKIRKEGPRTLTPTALEILPAETTPSPGVTQSSPRFAFSALSRSFSRCRHPSRTRPNTSSSYTSNTSSRATIFLFATEVWSKVKPFFFFFAVSSPPPRPPRGVFTERRWRSFFFGSETTTTTTTTTLVVFLYVCIPRAYFFPFAFF